MSSFLTNYHHTKPKINITVDNLFSFVDFDTLNNNSYLFIENKNEKNFVHFIGINANNKIIGNCHEWLSLLRAPYYPSDFGIYQGIVNLYNNISRAPINIEINEEAFLLSTNFSIGTVHGYTGIFHNINEYIKNYLGKKVIVFAPSQKGILDIINYFLFRLYGENYSSYLIHIEPNKKYKIKTLISVPNVCHNFYGDKNIDIYFPLFTNYIYNYKKDKLYYENKINGSIDNICILKTSLTDNKTSSGIINHSLAEQFCKTHNYTLIDPSFIDEIDLICIINYTKKLISSWGTALMKNYIHISDDCSEIDVYVIGQDFINQYNNFKNSNSLITKFKNANINYNFNLL